MRTRALAGGLAAVAAYLAVAAVLAAAGRPVLPIFDGLAPPSPYRWVNPPPEFAEENQPPLPGEFEVEFEDGETPAFSVTSGEAQGHFSFGPGVFEAREGEDGLRATIVPLDPEAIGRAPEGLEFQGNAYRAEVVYLPSQDEAPLGESATLVLRYPVHADHLLRWDGSAWVDVPGATAVTSTLQIFATVSEVGTYVAARAPEPNGVGFVLRLLPFVAAGAAVVLAAVLLVRKPSGQTSRGAGGGKGRGRKKPVRNKPRKRR